MHVLFVFNHPAPYKVKLFNEINKKIQISVIFERLKNKDRNPLFYESREISFNNIRIKGINIGLENHFSNGIVKHLKNNSYDIVIMNGWHTFSEMLALRYLKKHHKPYFFYINGGIIKRNEISLFKKIKTYFISGAELYFSPDQNSNKYLTYYGADESKIINYPYSTIYEHEIIAKPLSHEEKMNLRKALNVVCTKLFVSCGQFIQRKNYLRLINYWKSQPSENVLVIIGGGKEKNKYLKHIEKLGLKNVNIFDFVPHSKLFMYFRAADSYIFPSKEDIYGHVINEALSQGLPVISNKNVNSALRLINNGKNGHIVNIENDDEVSNAIQSVIENSNMPYEAIKTAKENTIETMSEVHIKVFKDWMERR